jgi:hypothetical protein
MTSNYAMERSGNGWRVRRERARDYRARAAPGLPRAARSTRTLGVLSHRDRHRRSGTTTPRAKASSRRVLRAGTRDRHHDSNARNY